MPKKSSGGEISIRVRLEKELLEHIDGIAGRNGRQRFIKEAILWRLDQELPPMVLEMADAIEELKTRVDHLEQMQSTSVYLGQLNDIVDSKVCRDDLDRKLLAYFIQHEGATTTDLAKTLLGSTSKRRTILDRISKLNNRAKQILGVPILEHYKGIKKNIRGAWWIINADRILT
jgi:uncharacterized protein Yka (UPF0111/DUF47 family)